MPNYAKYVDRIIKNTKINPTGRHYCGILVGSRLVATRMNIHGCHAEINALSYCIKQLQRVRCLE